MRRYAHDVNEVTGSCENPKSTPAEAGATLIKNFSACGGTDCFSLCIVLIFSQLPVTSLFFPYHYVIIVGILWHDIRYSARMLVKSPVTTGVAILSLAPVAAASSLAPAVAYAALFIAVIRATRALDPFLQRIALEAITFAALTTGLFALVYGQLEKAGEFPHLNVGLVVGVMMVLHAVGFVLAQRRYR